MSAYIRRHLAARLFLSYLAVVAVGMLVLLITSQSVLPRAFDRHMLGMQAGGMMGGMMGDVRPGPGPLGPRDRGLFPDFRAGFNEALAYATVAALAAALVLSLFLSRSIVAPVRRMGAASERIAEGRYSERVQVSGADELAELAVRFNQMAEKLEQVEAMRRQLIADVSHELRTPLTAIQGSMEGLIDGVLPASASTYEQVHAEAGRLSRLVDDLQELSRVEAGAYDLRLQPCDAAATIRSVVSRLAPGAAARSISVDADLPSDLPSARADPDRLAQILTNLAGNALQYTPPGGHVRIAALREGQVLRISIHDTGVGIPSEQLDRVFDRFYRVDKSRSRQAGGGSGIGLTIARALVEAQGGRIWAESVGAGQGATFHFTIPLA